MSIPTELQYTSEHEWVRIDGDLAVARNHAVCRRRARRHRLRRPPQGGKAITAGSVVGEAESTKSVGELFAPVSGEIVEQTSPSSTHRTRQLRPVRHRLALLVRVSSLGDLDLGRCLRGTHCGVNRDRFP